MDWDEERVTAMAHITYSCETVEEKEYKRYIRVPFRYR